MSRGSVCILMAAMVAVGSLVVAGDLNPPAGPVTPTMKTLDEVEARTAINSTNTPGDADSLYKIAAPGSYYLTGNVTGVAGKHGIEIVSSGVTLDLNGFDLVGVPGMGAFDGVSVTVDSLRGVTVRDGSVRNWGDGGVDLGFLSRGCRVEGVLASGNAGTGITSSISSTVTNCTSSFNGQRGIFSSNGSTITNCSVESNGGNGIQVNNGCTVANSAAYFNTGDGLFTGIGATIIDCSSLQNVGDGIQLGETSTANRCTATSNGRSGFATSDSCTITECTASYNTFYGISVPTDSTVSGCATRSNGISGIDANNRSTIRGCSSSANTLHGISVGGGVVVDCHAADNGVHGIYSTGGATIMNCTSKGNTNHGIATLGYGLISGNNCSSNGNGAAEGHGIRSLGLGARIIGNVCHFNDQGITAEFSQNFITGNSCKSNTTDWVIAANNAVGPILDRRNPGGAAISGFSAPTTLNTTDPHANFSH